MTERERFEEWINDIDYFGDYPTIRKQVEKDIMYQAWQARAEQKDKETAKLERRVEELEKALDNTIGFFPEGWEVPLGWMNIEAQSREVLEGKSDEHEEKIKAINIIFDGPPSHHAGGFVEVEDDSGKSINVGDWIERDDGYWALRIVGSLQIPKTG